MPLVQPSSLTFEKIEPTVLGFTPSAVQFLRPHRKAIGTILAGRPVQASSKGVNASLTEA